MKERKRKDIERLKEREREWNRERNREGGNKRMEKTKNGLKEG